MNSSKNKKETTEKTLEQLLSDEIWRDVTNPDVEKIESILKAGVDVNARLEDSGSFLVSDIWRLNMHLYHSNEDRKKYGSTAEAARVAFYNNHPNLDLRVVKLLLQYGADVNYTDEDDVSPLYHALYVPAPELIELLLKHGANPNYIDDDGYNILDVAYTRESGLVMAHEDEFASQKMSEIIEILKRYGAKCAVYK